MKRGFLNNKKAKVAKSETSCDDTGSHVVAAASPIQMSPSGDHATAVSSGPKKLSEPVVGLDIVEHITAVPSGAILLLPHAVVRIPYLTLTKSKEPSTTCLLSMSTCSTIAKTPGFYTSPPSQNLSDVVFTKNTKKMGSGLFAKRNIKAKELIFSERPLLVFPHGIPFFSPSGSQESMEQESTFEEVLQLALNAMTKEDADAFMSLSNCYSDVPPLYGISSTNSFATTIEKRNIEEGKCGYDAVGKVASRINHSCSPNVDMTFDIPTFSMRFVAFRNIEAGQQLFYCYCDMYRPAKERQRQLLTTHNFACKCGPCVNTTPESDRLREEMKARIEEITQEAEKELANPQFNLRSLDPWLKLEKEIVKEGLDFGDYFTVLIFSIFKAYGKLKIIPKQREYANKCQKLR